MQYKDHTQLQRRTSKDWTIPSHSTYRLAKHNRHATHNHDSKDLEYDMTSQKRTSLNQNNENLDTYRSELQRIPSKHDLHAIPRRE